MLAEEERPRREPFWEFVDVTEAGVVDGMLRRRFAETYAVLTECLETADPFDIVYPDNPDEYSDVIREIIVLLADVNASLRAVAPARIDAVVHDGLARRFGEEPDEAKVQEAVRLIVARASTR